MILGKAALKERWLSTVPRHLLPYLLIILLAAAVRVASAWQLWFHHPDEVWQYLEPTYRLLTGRGVVTWEFRENMRSWFVPALIAGPMLLGRMISGSDPAYLLPIRVALALGSLAIPVFGMAIGTRISRLHAIVVGLALATSFEVVYWSARALSETIALAFLLPAAWALEAAQSQPRRWAIAGCLLGLAVDCRFQVAPAAAVLVIGYASRDIRAWKLVIIGGLLGLAIGASADVAMGQPAFGWIAQNVRMNLIEHRAEYYGVLPAEWYVRNQFDVWGWAAIPLLFLAVLGGLRRPVLLAAALVHIAVHSLIPHKEYRFVLLSSVLLLLLAALGTAELASYVSAGRRKITLVVLGLFWVGTSAATALSHGGREVFTSYHQTVDMHLAAHATARCGLAVIGKQRGPQIAFSLYDRPTPILNFDTPDRLAQAAIHASEFDVAVMEAPDTKYILPGYAARACFGPKHSQPGKASANFACVIKRPGPCDGMIDSRFDINHVLARRGD